MVNPDNKCLKDPSYNYSGKEVSPTGIGYCPAFEKVGTIMQGRDGTSWIIVIKNGIHIWSRIPTLNVEVSTASSVPNPPIDNPKDAVINKVKRSADGSFWVVDEKSPGVWSHIPTKKFPKMKDVVYEDDFEEEFDTVEYEDDFETYTNPDITNSKKKIEGKFQHDLTKQDLMFFNNEDIEENIKIYKRKPRMAKYLQ
jgi:hypothetical protein